MAELDGYNKSGRVKESEREDLMQVRGEEDDRVREGGRGIGMPRHTHTHRLRGEVGTKTNTHTRRHEGGNPQFRVLPIIFQATGCLTISDLTN